MKIRMGSTFVNHNMTGDHDFNQVFFERLHSGSMRVGEEGDGWMQVTTERPSSKRAEYLNGFPLVKEMVREPDKIQPSVKRRRWPDGRERHFVNVAFGIRYARGGKIPIWKRLKELGVGWEQKIPSMAHDLFGTSPRPGGASDYERAGLYHASQCVFSLREREIVRALLPVGSVCDERA